MAQYRQFILTIVFLLASNFLFCSDLANGSRVRKTSKIDVPNLGEAETEWQEQLKNKNEEDLRMINSVIAKPNQYPYMVLLGLKKKNGVIYKHCGGSLITSNKILTAAHCVTEGKSTILKDVKDFRVLLGAHELSAKKNDAQLSRNVIKIKIHEKYNPQNWYNDIAILTLEWPVRQFTNAISPVCLPAQGTTDLYDGRLVYAKGWGHTEEEGNSSDFLRHVSKRILHHAECRHIFKSDNYPDHMMCAYQPGKGTCQGDSGGPLVIESKRPKCKYEQVGIVSWGYGCARRGYPGVFMRVTSFLPWIKMNT